jgi:hypothetical protein
LAGSCRGIFADLLQCMGMRLPNFHYSGGWMVTRAVDWAVVIGHLPAGLRPGRLGQLRVPAIERTPNVSRLSRSRHVTTRHKCSDPDCRRNTPDRRVCAVCRSRAAAAERYIMIVLEHNSRCPGRPLLGIPGREPHRRIDPFAIWHQHGERRRPHRGRPRRARWPARRR